MRVVAPLPLIYTEVSLKPVKVKLFRMQTVPLTGC